MVIQMRQLINNIKCCRWHSNIPCPIGQPHNMRALQIRIPSKPFLQSGMIKRIIHRARKEMQLHRHTIHCCFKMMKPYIITNFKMSLSIVCYIFSACIHPYIVSIRSTPYCISQKNVVPLHGGIIFLILRQDRKSTRLNSSHSRASRMPSSA